MHYFYNENNVKFKLNHELRWLVKSGYLFGYAIFPDSPIISLQKRKHKKLEKVAYLPLEDLGQIIQTWCTLQMSII